MVARRPFLARTVRGLEAIAAAEARERLDAGDVRIGHRSVRFSSTAAAAELLRLRSADDVFLVCGELQGVGHTRAALADLAERARTLALEPCLDWIAEGRDVRPANGFELVVSFLGRRNFSRYDVEDVVGEAIGRRLGLPLVRMHDPERAVPDVSIRLHLEHTEGVVGARVGQGPLHRRPYKRDSVPGSLHPPVAYALVRVAGACERHVLLDPFCGAGTIPIEAQLGMGPLTAVAADVSQAALRATRANANRAGVRVLPVRADAGRLPIRDGSIDRMVGNPPWRNQVGDLGSLRPGRLSLWREVSRVLAEGGCAVMLGLTDEDARTLGTCGLVSADALRLSLSGTWTTASIVSRSG